MRIAGFILFSIAVLVLVGCIFDAGCGDTHRYECQVAGHNYEPPWVETYSTTDSEGHQEIHSTQHSEVFHLICTEDQGSQTFDCVCNRKQYTVKTNGQEVTVRTRIGRWTKHRWMPTVED